MTKNWFDVDVDGLRQQQARRGKFFIIKEFYQNAADAEGTTRIDITMTKQEGRAAADLKVVDDSPVGFEDIRHASTLFIASPKKPNPTKRGLFDVGEKMAIACCEEAKIVSKNSAVVFPKDGDRRLSRERVPHGTVVTAVVPMTWEEFGKVAEEVWTIIPPPGIDVTFNGVSVPHRQPLVEFECELPTTVSDENGDVRVRTRATKVLVYEPQCEKPSVYEMGIPVVETGDTYHVDVQQRVILNVDRDNVTPSYLKELRRLVLEHTKSLLTEEDATKPWVQSVLPNVDSETRRTVLVKQHGERAVRYDPSDPEANSRAIANGYKVIHGGSHTGDVWNAIKEDGDVLLPAGQVTPSPKPYSPDGKPLPVIDEADWTEGMRNVCNFARWLASQCMDKPGIQVTMASSVTWPFGATYGGGHLTFNVGRLGKAWFEQVDAGVIDLLIHEFGHEYEEDHLSERYHKALTRLAGQVTMLAIEQPREFKRFLPKVVKEPALAAV